MTQTLPTISIVTPSLNQGSHLEAAVSSVIGQGYRDLEYVVIDGGSTDGSVEIIRSHQDRISYWVSEPDKGQYDAINKGFAHTSGEVMGWLNADDQYTPWTLRVVGRLFALYPQVQWLTSLFPLVWDETGIAVACLRVPGYSSQGFFHGENLPGAGWHARGWIQQESTFWRRSLWEAAGGYVDPSLPLAADFELWARFFKHAALVGVETPLGGFRVHGDQRSVHHLDEYVLQAQQALKRHGGQAPGTLASFLRFRVLPSLPESLRRVAVRAGLEAHRPICRYVGPQEGWRLRDL